MTALTSSAQLTRRPWRYISRAEFFIVGFFSVFFLGGFVLPRVEFFIYTPTAFVLGAILLFVAEDGYLEFVWWLWFLTPCLRRIVDLSIGYTSASPIMLAPLFVTMLCAIRLVTRFTKVPAIQFLAFGSISLSLLYGFFIGAINAGTAAAVFGLANWSLPLILCWYLAARPEKYQKLSAITLRSFLVGSLVMGLYGIYQFFYLPSWDAFWMVSTDFITQGEPFPMLVRVFGTLNSSDPYAIALMAGLLFLTAQARPLAWIAAVPALIGLLLSLVRTSWIGLGVGLIILMIRTPAKRQVRVFMGVGIALLMALPFLKNDTISTILFDRFQTFFALQEDNSYQDRSEFYAQARDTVLSNFVGTGIGTNGTATKLAGEQFAGNIDFDSGLIAVPFTLGIPGAVFFLSGFLLLCFIAFFARLPNDSIAVAALAVLVGTVIQAINTNVFTGANAIILWGMLGLLLSARQFHRVHAVSFPGAT